MPRVVPPWAQCFALPLLSIRRFLSAHFSSQSRSLWMAAQFSGVSAWFCVLSKLTQDKLFPIHEIISKAVEQCWTHHWPCGVQQLNHWPVPWVTTLWASHSHIFQSTSLSAHPAHTSPAWLWNSYVRQCWNPHSELCIDNNHFSPLIHQITTSLWKVIRLDLKVMLLWRWIIMQFSRAVIFYTLNIFSERMFLFLFRNFVNTFIQFKKPIIVAVNGPAIGLGASILPLCDVVWANEKAWFQTPYTTFGQSPDGCSSLTFPRIMGLASVSSLQGRGWQLHNSVGIIYPLWFQDFLPSCVVFFLNFFFLSWKPFMRSHPL